MTPPAKPGLQRARATAARSVYPKRRARAFESRAAVITEVLAVLHWSRRAQDAYVAALREWEAAGRPAVPSSAVDYRLEHRASVRRK